MPTVDTSNSRTFTSREVDVRRVITSSLAGTTIEWYEFFIYGTAAALVFGKLFFPQFDQLVGTLLSLSTFAVAFVARPIGAAIFGHFGDRIGRKAALVITLTMMGTCTFLIGILPSYETIGVWAPVTLIVLRVMQGLSLGGEYSGAVLMCVEHAGAHRRGLFGAIVNTGSGLGLILANIVFIAASTLSGTSFMTWGWRIPFLLSAILVILGLVIRLKIAESPEFEELKSEGKIQRAPILDTFRRHSRTVILTAFAYVAAGVTFYMAAVYALNYGQQVLALSRNAILTLVLVAFVLNVIAMPLFGWLSDRYDRRRIFLLSAAAMVLSPFLWFALLDTRSPLLMAAGFFILFIPFSANYGVMPTYFADSFPARVRYTGMAIGYTLGTVLGSALAPIVATSLLAATQGWTAIAIYMSGSAVVSFTAAVFLFERGKVPTRQGTVAETVPSL